MEVLMRRKIMAISLILLLSGSAFSQDKPAKPNEEQPIRISTELIQLDVVVTDKAGKIVRGLPKDSFELYEKGKKQQISFFEYVDANKERTDRASNPADRLSGQGPSVADISRIFAFVVDDLTTRPEDLVYIRQMLTSFIDNRMRPDDLVAIVRTVGGRGLLQQFTTDKNLLRRAVVGLTAITNPFNAYNRNERPTTLGPGDALTGPTIGETNNTSDVLSLAGENADITGAFDETNQSLRSFMSLGTASFVIDSMKQLPGRKSLILISGGLPVIGSQPGVPTNNRGVAAGQPTAIQVSTSGVNISYFINLLTDKAARAGVAINTMDIRGLSAQAAAASFTNTPGRSAMDAPNLTFGRLPDESMLGDRNPFDTMDAQMGLRILAEDTGGIAVLNKNNFNEGLEKIVGVSEGYYLLAYTPLDSKFDGNFRRIEIKVKGDGYKVHSRRGYFAREEKPVTATSSVQEQMLTAIKSPLARRDIDLDAMMLYKATPDNKAALDVHLVIDPRKLQFKQASDKQQTMFDVAGFVFDQFGRLQKGFSETITASLTPQEFKTASAGGLSYTANMNLSPGIYQVRLAVRDHTTGGIGTLSRYLEVPDLTKKQLAVSSLLLGSVPAGDTKAASPTPISANRQVPRSQDLRYAVIIYNAKTKDGQPQVRTQLTITQNGKVLYKENEQAVPAGAKDATQLLQVGQVGLKGVPPGRYTMTVVITDPLADKKSQTITRTMDFIVIN
jgi:VWFA-related protein